MTSRHRLASALDKVFPHLLILLYSLGAAVIYDHHWPFPQPGDNPILDLDAFHRPRLLHSPQRVALPGSRCRRATRRNAPPLRLPSMDRHRRPTGRKRHSTLLAVVPRRRHTWHCDRRDSSPRSGEREQSPRLAYNPRKRSLYRSRDFRGRRLRQDLSLHVSLCPTDFKLAGQKSAAPRRGAGSGSQRRLLPFHSQDAC